MKIFIAIPISEELKHKIVKWILERKDKMDEQIRWMPGENLHVTLVPPWYESDIDGIKQRLLNIHGRKPFKIAFNKVVYGPGSNSPRLIWAEGALPIEIRELKTEIESLLDIESDKREFILHLTLARFREEVFKDFEQKKIEEEVSWEEEVKSVVIMESIASKEGAIYKVLEEVQI